MNGGAQRSNSTAALHVFCPELSLRGWTGAGDEDEHGNYALTLLRIRTVCVCVCVSGVVCWLSPVWGRRLCCVASSFMRSGFTEFSWGGGFGLVWFGGVLRAKCVLFFRETFTHWIYF